MRKILVRCIWSIMLVILMNSRAIAHQYQHATTLIEFRDNETIEISHRFYIHDAETVLASLTGKHQDLIQNQQAQDTLCDYVYDQFELRYQTQEPFVLERVGCEIEGKYLWVYQESAYTNRPNAISVKFSAFQPQIPQQINLINVRIDRRILSLELKSTDNWKTLDLKKTE